MNTTALFVELLIIGFGAAGWLGLIFAGILKRKFTLPDRDRLLPLIAVVYVLGISTDRPIRELFISTMEIPANRMIFTPAKIQHIKSLAPYINENNMSMELEKYIRVKNPPLASKIDYNRSRLRICRAWVLHFFLIGLTLIFWNARVKEFSTLKAILVGMLLIGLSFLTLRTTWLLVVDHQKDISESFEAIISLK